MFETAFLSSLSSLAVCEWEKNIDKLEEIYFLSSKISETGLTLFVYTALYFRVWIFLISFSHKKFTLTPSFCRNRKFILSLSHAILYSQVFLSLWFSYSLQTHYRPLKAFELMSMTLPWCKCIEREKGGSKIIFFV